MWVVWGGLGCLEGVGGLGGVGGLVGQGRNNKKLIV